MTLSALSTPTERSLELELSERAWDELSLIREMLSRLQYAPSRKTILQGLLAILPDWCLENADQIEEVRGHEIWKARGKMSLSDQEGKEIFADLFSTPMREIDFSRLLDYLLIHFREDAQRIDLHGLLLGRLMRGQYVKKKGIMMFRLPRPLEEAIFPDADYSLPAPNTPDTWKRRYSDSTKEFQQEIQGRLEELFLKATKIKKEIWPPLASKIAECRCEAERLLRDSASLRVLSIQLGEEAMTQVRKMEPGNPEIATVATLVWCEKNKLI